MKTASWVIKVKATGRVLFETFNTTIPERLNKERYEAVPILEHLATLNHSQTYPTMAHALGRVHGSDLE
mgnify:FL=1